MSGESWIFVTRVLQHYYKFHFCNMPPLHFLRKLTCMKQPCTDPPAPWSAHRGALCLTSQEIFHKYIRYTSSGLTVNTQKQPMCFSGCVVWILYMYACLHVYSCLYVWLEDLWPISCHRFAVGGAGPDVSGFRECQWEQEQWSSSWRGEFYCCIEAMHFNIGPIQSMNDEQRVYSYCLFSTLVPS